MNEYTWILSALFAGAVVGLFVWQQRSPKMPGGPPAAAGSTLNPTADKDLATEAVERISEGVVLLDESLRPRFANAAARHMLGFGDPWLPARLSSDAITAMARDAMQRRQDVERTLVVTSPLPMDLRVRVTHLEDPLGVLVALRDVTQENSAQRMRREFVTNASHELKSPVAGIQTLAEAIADAANDDPAIVERFSRRLVAEADRLSRLIADLLDLSRLEEQPTPSSVPMSLSIVARREIETVLTAADEKAIALRVEVEPNIELFGEEQQLGLLVRNLLENALRYTPEAGTVALRVYAQDAFAFVEVQDDGIGIPPDAQARIFERFYRVDRARSRQSGGTGLGLAIVKHVAEVHGGEVSLRSAPGQGSTFRVRLPRTTNEPTEESRAAESMTG